MPNYQPISKTTHGDLRWKRYRSYFFAAQDVVAPLVAQELSKAAMALPVAFIEQDGGYTLAAVQGLQPEQNLFVASDGRWIGGYTPAVYRGYPFALATAETDKLVLCVDADSGLVGERFSERFFDENGEPSQSMKDLLTFLEQVHANRMLTRRLCAGLAAEGLIQPWPINLRHESGDQALQGLYRIDEAKLNTLDAEAVHRLYKSGALAVVYCQLLSMQHLQVLAQLASAQAQAQTRASGSDELNFDFLSSSDSLSFGPH